MKKRKFYIVLLFVFSYQIVSAQFNGNNFSISANYNFTTTSKLYLNPNSYDPLIRSIHQTLDDIFSYSIELRYRLSEPIIVGLGLEYIKKVEINPKFNLGGTRVEIKEGYLLIPVEMSIYYVLPFSTESYKFFMGGGTGIYSGNRIREIGDVKFEKEKSKIGYGIHVVVGMEYLPNEFISIRGQMRFRDPEIELESKYSKPVILYNGRTFPVSTDVLISKVNIDGVTFSIGVSINF